MLTSYLRIGERTEVELPGAAAPQRRRLAPGRSSRACAPVGSADGSTTFVLSSWEGNTWLTVDDSGTLEMRRWMDGDMLVTVRARQRDALVYVPL